MVGLSTKRYGRLRRLCTYKSDDRTGLTKGWSEREKRVAHPNVTLNDQAMKSLEARVPPPLVAAVIALAMWVGSRLAPSPQLPNSLRVSVAARGLFGGIRFQRCGTPGVSASANNGRSDQTGTGLLFGSFGHLPNHAQSHVRRSLVCSRRLGSVPVLGVAAAWADRLRVVYSAVPNRARGACTRQTVRQRVRGLSSEGASVAVSATPPLEPTASVRGY